MLDADIRRALLQHLAAHPLIIEEMGVCGQVRCDVVALSEEMVGYEIKSDADTLRRLPRQVEWYSRVLDRAHVVTTERHLEGVRSVVPEWWGVMVASGPADDVRLQPLREAEDNPSLDTRSLADLLWRPEALAALEVRGLARGYRSKTFSAMADRLTEHVPPAELRSLVHTALMSRQGWR